MGTRLHLCGATGKPAARGPQGKTPPRTFQGRAMRGLPCRSERSEGARNHTGATHRANPVAVQITRSTISFLISAMALAGFSPLGQVLVQFMMVWQR